MVTTHEVSFGVAGIARRRLLSHLPSTTHVYHHCEISRLPMVYTNPMTAGKIWSGNAVRKLESASIGTRHFTAADASSNQVGQVVERTADPLGLRQHGQDSSRWQASAHLERGQDMSTTATLGPKTGRNEVSANGTKRVSDCWNESKPKRSKHSENCSGNEGQKESSMKSPAGDSSRTNMDGASQTMNSNSKPTKRKASDQNCFDTDTAVPVPVYASATSMNSLKHGTQITSLDSFRLSAQTGRTSYSTSPLPDLQQTGVEFSRPWLNAVTGKTTSTVSPAAQPPVSYQRPPSATAGQLCSKANAYTPKQSPTHDVPCAFAAEKIMDDSDIYSDDLFDEETLRIVNSVAANVSPSMITSLPSVFAAEKPRDESDIYSDDLFDEETLRIVDSIAANVSPSMISSLPQIVPSVGQQLPSVPNLSLTPADERNALVCQVSEEDRIDEYGLDEIEEELIMGLMASKNLDGNHSKIDPSALAPETNMRDVDGGVEYDEAPFTAPEGLPKRVAQEHLEPIVRRPFPSSVPNESPHDSPLYGVCNSTSLRTCFRIGEALKTGCHSVRQHKSVIIELYARVIQSWREDGSRLKQHFVFRDLYHPDSPVLHGTFDLYDQVDSCNLDSGPFIHATEQGMKCRVVAIMKRDGKGWRLKVLSISEASWDDIEYVAEIYKNDVVHEARLEG
nr:hypothetical protein CFP56_65904 [Quercus suber]